MRHVESCSNFYFIDWNCMLNVNGMFRLYEYRLILFHVAFYIINALLSIQHTVETHAHVLVHMCCYIISRFLK
jgi:hypothetical protein